MTTLILFGGDMKNMVFFFFFNKRNVSYPGIANVPNICFACLLGNPHWVASSFASGSGNALGFRLCKMETFK